MSVCPSIQIGKHEEQWKRPGSFPPLGFLCWWEEDGRTDGQGGVCMYVCMYVWWVGTRREVGVVPFPHASAQLRVDVP